MKLYGHPASTCTRKVLTALAEKGQAFEFVVVDIAQGEQKSPTHLARQPFGVVPVFEDDDGFQMYESRAILRYLDARLPNPSLSPVDLQERGRMEQWISVESSYFTPAAMKIIYQLLFFPMRGLPSDMAVVETARTELGKTCDILDKVLAERPYLAGATFSLADICYLPYIEYLFACKQGDLITSRQNLAEWWQRCSSRPSWVRASGKSA